MSNTLVGILGLLTIVAIVVTLFKSKTQPAIAFIVWPSILALILVLGGRHSFDNIAAMIKAGFNSTGPTAALFVFSVLYFGIMTDAGMFDVIIGKLMKLVGDNVMGVALVTCIIALVGHLDGGGASTFCIVVPAMLPVYKRMHIKHRDEIVTFLKQLLRKSMPGLAPKLVLAFIRMYDEYCKEKVSNHFLKLILFPEKAKEIIDTLHFLINGEVGKGAATVMWVTYEEGLISSCKYDDIKDEFTSISQKAYNKEILLFRNKTHDEIKEPIRTQLRTRIGYTKLEDGTIEFHNNSLSPRNMFIHIWRWVMSFFY